MRLSRTAGSLLGAAAAAALFTACSAGSQLAPGSTLGGANGSLAQSRSLAAHNSVNGILGAIPGVQPAANPGPGWMSAEAAAGTMLLYVADQSGQRVVIYPQRGQNPAPIGQITDAIGGPDGLFVDSKGTLYVCNFGTATVSEYPKGQTTHSKILTGAGSPKYVVVGLDGTVYVSNFNASQNGTLLEYANGSTTPTTTIPFQTFPAGLALDKRNRLYVAYDAPGVNDIEVLRFAPGKTTGKNLGIHMTGGSAGGAAIDSSGNLLVDNQGLPGVAVFPPGETQPSQLITGFSLAYQIALNHRNNHLYVSQPFNPPVVNEVTYPGAKHFNTIGNSLSGAFGVATSPDGSP